MTRIVLILTLLLPRFGQPATAQNTTKDCKPPIFVSQPSFSDEDREKWKGKSVHGTVATIINEAGEVAEAKVIAASPKGVEKALVNAAKRAKFQPRKGCGEVRLDISFNLGH